MVYSNKDNIIHAESKSVNFSPEINENEDYNNNYQFDRKKEIAENENSLDVNMLIQWIKTNQEVHGITKDVIQLYSPLLAVYFVYVYVTVAFTIFSAILNTHSHTMVEVMVLAYFTLLTLINFYMLCAYGNFIMVESGKVSWAVYAAPWYNSTPDHKSFIKIILQRAARPTVVNCFSSTSFDLTNSTFIVIMKSVVSFYLGLVQMRKQQTT
ncbi:uncharacterized protein LOC142317730 [Lycorma delicatula]|uniref:uncharacterized protein LOC142317730 n=1 Tax=Lycorma delicatula TaxID=130591 RepID=UPI003F517DE4